MKQFMNSKETLVTEALDGLIRASNGRLARLDGYPHIKVAIRADWEADQKRQRALRRRMEQLVQP